MTGQKNGSGESTVRFSARVGTVRRSPAKSVPVDPCIDYRDALRLDDGYGREAWMKGDPRKVSDEMRCE